MKFQHLLGAAAALSLLAIPALAQNFPARELNGIIMWGAGGATDVVARAVTPVAEEALGQKIVLQNKAGGAGAISTAFVNAAPADGYTVLYGAENPQLHGVLGVSDLDYSKFYPISILGYGVAVIVTKPDSPWNSFKDLVADAQKRPNAIKMGSTGPGGLPHVVGALLNTVTKLQVTAVPFEGEGPGLVALQGGHVDFMPTGLGAAFEHIKAGRLKVLTVINGEKLPALPAIAPITDEFPDMAKYLPWGPFYGVFVRNDVPADAKIKLVAAFEKAGSDPKFVGLMEGRGNIVLNTSGPTAQQFLKSWQQTTTWVLHDAGATKRSPEEFGIKRP